MEFRQWVENRYRHPVVLVLASPAVESACRRNGMSLIQMLRPFSVYPTELYARLGNRADASTVRNFGVRLRRVHCVREVAPSQLKRHFLSLMRDHAAMDLAYGEQLDRSISPLLKKTGGVVEGPLLSSHMASQLLERSNPFWRSQFIRDYVHLVRCSYFDTIDHPIGCIYAASTSVQGGIDAVINEFKEQQQWPAETRRDMPCMDDDLHSYYLLIHDVTEGPSIEEARRLLVALQGRYGHAHCALVKINSVVNPQDIKNMDPSLWVEANASSMDIPSYTAVRMAQKQQQQQQQQQQRCGDVSTDATTHGNGSFGTTVTSSIVDTRSCSSVGSGSNSTKTPGCLQLPCVRPVFDTWPSGMAKVTGCYMSPENVEDLRNAMLYYLSQCLFNFMERKLRALTVVVNEKRTTTLSKVAAWFRNKDEVKSKSECWVVSRDGGPTMYLAGSLEMQMRRAADLSLSLADYDSAVNFYRLCRNEALSTLSSREFNRPLIAACQEAVGICDLLQGRLPLPSLTPATTGVTASKSRGDCRLEIAQNDYVACQVHTYALRMAFLLYEYCCTRTPPTLDRVTPLLLHVQRTGMTADNKFYSAVLHDLLASSDLFLNPPQPAGMTVPASISNNFQVYSHLRQYARHITLSGSAYLDENLLESALRCHLRALRVCVEVGRRGHWQLIFEHLHTIIAQIYHKLGNHTRGIAMTAIAVSMGTPMYSNPTTGVHNFDSFWRRQRQVVADLGFALCPHMVVPCILPDSVRVSVNEFHCDELTKLEMQMVSNEFSEVEWRKMENKLRTHYTQHVFTSPHHCCNWRGDAAKMQRSNNEGGRRCYLMHLTESLGIEVTLHNPVGGALMVENICLLYVAKHKPDKLWKSAASSTVEFPSGASKSLTFAFSPCVQGTYIIVGFCWTLMEVEGYYYFATQAYMEDVSKGGNNDDNTPILEYAMHHPTPNIESPANLEVVVGPPRAWITAQIQPELPSIMRDGEYYRTSLILTNKSPHREAHNITLQRSPQNSQSVWFESFGFEQNFDAETTLVLGQGLAPAESITLPLVVQAQHAHDSSSRCRNSILFLVGYTSAEASQEEGPASPSSTATPGAVRVRFHRFVRRMMVKPTILLSSIVLPPANASMAMAVLLTASNISALREPPVRVSRVLAVHRPRWRVAPAYLGTLLEENAVECILPSAGALSISLSVLGKAPSEMKLHADAVSRNPCGLVEETCIPLKSALPAPSKKAVVEANLGANIVDSVLNLYFMRCRFRGEETNNEAQARNGLSFYLDKKGALKPPASEGGGKLEERPKQQEQHHHLASTTAGSDAVEPLTPICIAVAWVVEEDDRTYSGQVFHFVDPVSFLRSRTSAVDTAHERMQDHLCRSMIDNRTIHPRSGALFYYVDVPHTVSSTAALPDVILIPVTLHCRSFSAHPLMVTVTLRAAALCGLDKMESSASPPLSPVPLTFVGKTGCAFLLMPHETHILDFTACAHSFGFVQCNAFQVTAVALNLPALNGTLWKTGMSLGAMVASLNDSVSHSRSVPSTTSILPTTLSAKTGCGRCGNVSGTQAECLGALVCSEICISVEGHRAAATTRVVPAAVVATKSQEKML